MKNQVLFSSTDKSKKLKCRLLQFLFGALMVKPKQATEWAAYHHECSTATNINGTY